MKRNKRSFDKFVPSDIDCLLHVSFQKRKINFTAKKTRSKYQISVSFVTV